MKSVVSVRLSDRAKQVAQAQADSHGMSRSGYINKLILSTQEHQPDFDESKAVEAMNRLLKEKVEVTYKHERGLETVKVMPKWSPFLPDKLRHLDAAHKFAVRLAHVHFGYDVDASVIVEYMKLLVTAQGRRSFLEEYEGADSVKPVTE